MKFFATSLLATLAVASPIAVTPAADLSARQLGSLNPMTSNDVKDGSSSSCPKAIFIFARASGEQGNMVRYSPAWNGSMLLTFFQGRVYWPHCSQRSEEEVRQRAGVGPGRWCAIYRWTA